jgi:flagellar hook-associated protein 2
VATSTSSIDGLISGMSTASVITQLLSIDKQPQVRLQVRKAEATATVNAYRELNTRFSALQSAGEKVANLTAWKAHAAKSSSTEVTVSASTTALNGSITFDVSQIAKAQAYVSQASYSSTSAIVTTSATATLTKGDGTPKTVDLGDGSLAAVVAGINAADASVRAAAVQVAPGSYKLQLTSTTTGAASTFSFADGANATPLGTLTSLVTGQDAQIVVGVGSPGQYTITSASNTLADVVPGLTLTVKNPVNGVTVDVSSDVVSLKKDIQAMVDAANKVLTGIKEATAYDADKKAGAVLVGDATVRALQQRLLSSVSQTVGALGNAGAAGLEVAKDGTLTFDAATFDTAYAADPAKTMALFRPGGTMAHADPAYSSLPGKVAFTSAGTQTAEGTYAVKVTQAATQARIEVTGAVVAGDQFTLTVPGLSAVVVTAQAGDDLTALAARINTASATGTLGLVARVESGALQVRTASYGSAPTFTLTTTGAQTVAPIVAGLDVAGSINGVAATGTGQLLQAPIDDVTLRGLALTVTATAADVATAAGQAGADQNLFGSFTYRPGVAQRLVSTAGDAVRSGTGRLTTVIAGKQSQIDNLTTQISAWDARLEFKESAYRRQFASLETALGKLRDQSSWLAGQIGSLSGLSASSK